MPEILSKIQTWGLLLLIFLVPVFFLPITQDSFDFQKTSLLVGGVAVLTLVWALRSLVVGKLNFSTTPFDLPIVLFAAAVLFSTLTRTPNKVDAFFIPGTTTLILALTLLYFLIVQTAQHRSGREGIIHALLGSGFVVSLVSIWAGLGVTQNLGMLPSFLKSTTFSLLGAPLPTISFLLVLTLFAVGKVYQNRKDKTLSFVYFVFVALFVVGLSFVAFQVSSRPEQMRLLPVSSGWAVAVETLKLSPFGVGLGNFLEAFNAYKPRVYNDTDLWNVRFSTSSNWYLDVFTQAGFLGLTALGFLVFRVARRVRSELMVRGELTNAIAAVILASLLFIPGNLMLLLLFYLSLALFAAREAREHSLALVSATEGKTLAFFPVFVLLVALTLNIVVFVLGGRAYKAEVVYKNGLDAVGRNDAQTFVRELNNAINLNPYVARYHITASGATLAIANSIARSGDINDERRKQISQLVQESIRQAQIAVALNKQSSVAWENLGNVYRALITVANNAQEWSVLSLNQAIALEPTSPVIRVELGAVYYGTQRYDDAVRAFELAVLAKPDWANAHYNLALALREKGDIERAAAEMEKTLSLVSPGSKDAEIAQKELENLRSKLPKASGETGLPAQAGETLAAPEKKSEPVLTPPLELGQEASPSGGLTNPAPTAFPKASPTPLP